MFEELIIIVLCLISVYYLVRGSARQIRGDGCGKCPSAGNCKKQRANGGNNLEDKCKGIITDT